MEYKANKIITYRHKDETIYLKVTPTTEATCKDCFFHATDDDCDNCANIRNIIGQCDACLRSDNTPIIFRKINNTIIKKTIDIYVIMEVHKRYRSFCDVFTSFEEANNRFEELLKSYEYTYDVKANVCNFKGFPSQLKIYIVGPVTLYLCKETKEIDIKYDLNDSIFDI